VSTSTNSDLFTRVRSNRASADVVTQLRDAIEQGHLAQGDRLPSERDLATRLEVSRATVRDALRILEAKGLVDVRVGARGGAFVTAPQPERVRESLTDMLMMSTATGTDITAARSVVELGLLELACAHATSDDIADLEAICDDAEAELSDGRFDPDRSTEFHLRLASCTHNVAIELLVAALQDPTRRSLAQAKAADPAMGHEGVKEHRRLVRAIARRDVTEAQAIMREHLDRTARRLAGQQGVPQQTPDGVAR
jgi:GntR family transcriptional regulator, transcriptional repressor for pyruvate dehydrogenase complex